MQSIRASFLLTAALALLSGSPVVLASPDSPGPCSSRLERLGYLRPELKNVSTDTSLYEAYRGRDEVKLVVENQSCQIQQTWLDD